jgi:hypothetical protein
VFGNDSQKDKGVEAWLFRARSKLSLLRLIVWPQTVVRKIEMAIKSKEVRGRRDIVKGRKVNLNFKKRLTGTEECIIRRYLSLS